MLQEHVKYFWTSLIQTGIAWFDSYQINENTVKDPNSVVKHLVSTSYNVLIFCEIGFETFQNSPQFQILSYVLQIVL